MMSPEQKKLSKQLLQMEKLGVLDRDICYHSIPLDEEFGQGKLIPPRLFFLYEDLILIHCYGDDAFYEKHPEFERGGLSKECWVIPHSPRFLSNYFAMEEMYQKVGVVPVAPDPISWRQVRPPPLTKQEVAELRRRVKRRIRQRSESVKLELVK